jgi:hypothetical protein
VRGSIDTCRLPPLDEVRRVAERCAVAVVVTASVAIAVVAMSVLVHLVVRSIFPPVNAMRDALVRRARNRELPEACSSLASACEGDRLLRAHELIGANHLDLTASTCCGATVSDWLRLDG